MWQVEQWLLEDVYIRIPGNCECVTLHSERDFADMIELRIFRCNDYPGLSGWTQ